MLEIITLDQKERWNAIVRSMTNFDFYHLAEYHQLELSGQSLLLSFSVNNTSIAFPVILRPVEKTSYYDITSVYGYAGPLTNLDNPDEESLKYFRKDLLVFFDNYNIISAFSRLHPFFSNQETILSGLGEVITTNQTVGIDLSLPEQEQKKQYAYSLKYQINRLKSKNIIVKKAKTVEEIDQFIEIYRENMKRVNASEMYFFTNDYFYHLIKKLPFTLLLAYYEGRAICGSLFSSCNGIVQLHLSATLNDFLIWSPSKLVLDCIRRHAIENNERWLHLGGGSGGEDDSLFQYKSFFSNLRFTFKTWRYIHNAKTYNQLISEKFSKNVPNSPFFPLYRLGNEKN